MFFISMCQIKSSLFITSLSYEHLDTIETNPIEILRKGQQPSLHWPLCLPSLHLHNLLSLLMALLTTVLLALWLSNPLLAVGKATVTL